MNRRRLLIALLPVGLLAVATVGRAQKPAETPATPENIEAAFKLTLAAAAEYEFRIGKDEKEKPLELIRESKLKWSNPAASDIQGNVFLWTREGRPLVVGSLYKWFSPKSRMEHEFHSLAEESLSAKFHGKPVWKTDEVGLKFVDVPNAGAPAANEAKRLLQLKQLAKEFTGIGKYRKDPNDTELRLLPHPIHSYAAPKQDIINGGLFAFVRGTDPEIILLIEARGKDVANARWQFAVARMSNIAELRLRHQNKQVWATELLTWGDVFGSHELAYTAFAFNEIPDFLKEAIPKLKP